MAGRWVGYGYCPVYLEINKNNHGRYGTFSADKGCGGKSWKGKVTFTNTHLYVGSTTFKFIQKPTLYIGNDSISDSWQNMSSGKVKIIASMIVRTSLFHHNDEHTFFKILDY
ncbi:MAG: hypothetical protein JNK50_01720 [Bacteroidia bacterium]|nr:hypothetical protein [Bacteroidia bacterium]